MSAREPEVRLHKPLRRVLRAGHPWIYRDALEPMRVEPGTTVTVVDERGRFVARGLAEAGPIAVRVWTVRDEAVDAALIEARLDAAVALRDRVIGPDTNAYRLLHGEGDRMPGLVCDVYDRYASVQLDGEAVTAVWDIAREALVQRLRSRGIEGIVVRTGRRGKRQVEVAWGVTPPDEVAVTERGMTLCADVLRGQKTGLFLDHRESRRRVHGLADGLRVLDLYSYVGGFSAAAGLGGARQVTTVDAAQAAIEHAGRTWAANGLGGDRHECIVSDVPELLAAQVQAGRRYDFIIADPPSFAPRQDARRNAMRAYVKLHRACLELLEVGGLYLAASCSSHVDARAFDETLVEAGQKGRRILQVLDRWGAPTDHPRIAGFSEGDYLSVVLMRVVG